MPRYESSLVKGVVVNVPEEKAKNLVGFKPVAEEPKKAPSKTASTKKK